MGSEDEAADTGPDIFDAAIELGLEAGLDGGGQIDENEGSYQSDLDDDDEGRPGADGGSEDEGLDADDADGHGDSGGAESQRLERGEGASPESQVQEPQPPAGFQSWDHFRWAQQQHLQQQAAYQAQQQAQYQEQQRQLQQQAQQSQGFQWQPPAQRSPEIDRAMQLRGTPEFKNLSPHIQDQAEKLYGYVQGNWDSWTHDPPKLARDVVMPEVAKRYDPEITAMRQKIAALEAEAFKRKHQADLPDQQSMQRYLGLVEQMRTDPYGAGLKFMQLAKALEGVRAGTQGTKTKAKDEQARQKSARGRPSHKGRTKGRRGSRQKPIAKEDRTNAAYLAEAAKQALIEAGEMSPGDFGE